MDKGISRHTGFILSTLMLIILVTIAAYVEGSVLLSAFLAGAIIRYTWQSGGVDMEVDLPTIMFEGYYKPIMDHILVPFFFASIGFSIPVSEMFRKFSRLERNLLCNLNVSSQSNSRTRPLF
ncbi:hypothetical protein EYC84_008500 [Monilinia fructicola]|uniref:Cation/H+ exchanger transmembrane domain-containing protein n=1 Tax=Monilinia fructicola TaxID=38448 RepID=A0A5M9JFJ8_MONFR|nr:hypothetical protein EYC84_008500 [Monilinia fructicola]